MQMIKVKVKKLAEQTGPKPLYQQDEVGGLNAYFLPMQMKKEDEGEQPINNSEPIVDRDEANVELEKGEVVFDIMTDVPQLRRVGGKTHAQGGTPADLEQGAFIFSHFLKMSDAEKEVLDIGGKEPSYADFAKKYIKPFNEAVRTLKTSDDRLDKETAAMVIDNIKGKLSKVALLQESSKGFPDGVPEFASEYFGGTGEEGQQMMKFGGLMKAQMGQMFSGMKRTKEAFQDSVKNHGFVVDPKSPYWATKTTTSLKPVNTLKTSPKKMGNEQWYNTYVKPKLQEGISPEELIQKGYMDNSFLGRAKQDFVPTTGKSAIYYEDPTQNKEVVPNTLTGKLTPPVTSDVLKQNDAGKTFNKPFKDTGYGIMEAIGMASPFAQAIKKYAPVKKAINPQNLSFRPVDFEVQRQSMKGQVAQAQDVNTLLSPTTASASARNSELLGKSLNSLNESFMNEFNTNQMGYQQVEGQNAQFRQQADLFNAQAADQYDTNYAQMNENFDARKAHRFRQFMQQWQTADKSRQQRNMLNYLMTDYQIGPNQEISQVVQSKDQRQTRITGNTGSPQSGELGVDDHITNIKAIMDRHPELNLTWEQAASMYRQQTRPTSNSQLKMMAKQLGIELD